MKIRAKDYNDAEKVTKIITDIEKLSLSDRIKIVDEINVYQPFLISLFLGYKDKLDKNDLGEFIIDIIIVWRFFSDNQQVKKKKITPELYREIDRKNFEMLNYLSGETSEKTKRDITEMDLSTLDSKALLTGVFYRYKRRNALRNIHMELIIGLKALIECFERII
ncbi:hypothetical protein DMA11_24130 [Marinilabiliaceae bacterium JC017]|nr:hypothetical protein DMA11_24130 [Marinilabiliaceae bacterium JC017]